MNEKDEGFTGPGDDLRIHHDGEPTLHITDGTVIFLEKIDGEFRCDFCHELSTELVRLRFPGVIYTPCPKCLKKIQKAIQAWYNWSQETLVEKLMLESMKE